MDELISVIKSYEEKFHRAATWHDGRGEYPGHWVDIQTGEIVVGKVSIKFQTNDEWGAEDAVKSFDARM